MQKIGTDERRFHELLARGGVASDDDEREIGDPPAKYNGLADPTGVEELASALASRVAQRPSVVVVWEDPEDAVLGHVVARTLGLPVVRAYNADGLVGHGPGFEHGASVLLVADAIRDPVAVRAVRALAEREGGRLVATAVLIETSTLRDLADEAGEIIGLVRAGDAGQAGSQN